MRGVGLRTVEQLHVVGAQVVAVDTEPDGRTTSTVLAPEIPHLTRGAHIEDTLRDAGLAGASAVVCAQDRDLDTLECALLVHDLRPDVRVVVQLDNPAVGRAVGEVTGAGTVLDVAGLFAPSVVETCLRQNAHHLVLGGEHFVAAEVRPTASATLRGLYADLAPMGVAPADGGELVVCPGRDHKVAEGDRVWVLGTPAELAVAANLGGSDRATGTAGADPDGGPIARLRRAVAVLIGETDRSLRIALGLVAAVVLVSTLVLTFAYHASGGAHGFNVLDALYLTVVTIATVGYGDFNFSGQSQWLEAYGILLVLVGATLVTTVFALITNLLVSRRIEQSLGRRRVTGMEGHVVLVGLGAVGMRALEGLLARGLEVVVVERDEANRYLSQARSLGAPVIVGDATLPTTLESVNLSAASAVAVLTSDDLTNIETGLAIRDQLGDRWPDVPMVLRVFDRALGRRVEDSFQFHHVWSTAALAAPWFVGAALGLEVIATFYVDHEPFMVAQLTVAPDGGLAGVAMRDLSARMRVIAISHVEHPDRLEHPPRRDTRFAPGDRAYLAGPYEELLLVLRREQDGGRVLIA